MTPQLLLVAFVVVSAGVIAGLIALDRGAHPVPHHLSEPPGSATDAADAAIGAAGSPWRPGDDPFAPDEAGEAPDDELVTQRHWVNRSIDGEGGAVYGATNLARLRRGLPPQRFDPRSDAAQTMIVTVDHERRTVTAAWPGAAVDPFDAEDAS